MLVIYNSVVIFRIYLEHFVYLRATGTRNFPVNVRNSNVIINYILMWLPLN